jgi:hypothetical protein
MADSGEEQRGRRRPDERAIKGFCGIVSCLTLVGMLILAPVSVGAQQATPTTGADLANLVLPPDAPAYGLSYEAWTARFGQWLHSLPIASDPGADPTGERCGYGQAGPVFFLVQAGDAPAARTCTIPAGTALLLPLLDASCTTVEPPPFFGRDETELRACTEALFTPVPN